MARTKAGLPRNALFHNEEGTFVDVSSGSGADLAVRGNGCVAADFDLDGRTDLYVTAADRARCSGTTATAPSPRARRPRASRRSAGTPPPRSAT